MLDKVGKQWRDSRAIPVALVAVLGVAAIYFWFAVNNSGRVLPSNAVAPGQVPMALPGGPLISDSGLLVFTRLSRGEYPLFDAIFAGMLIWLPTLTALCAFHFLFLFHRHLRGSITLLLLLVLAAALSLILENVYLPLASVVAVIAGVAVMSASKSGGDVDAQHKRSKERRKVGWHGAIALSLVLSAVTLSGTTHRIFQQFHGAAIFPDVSFAQIVKNLEGRLETSSMADPVVARMNNVPSFSALSVFAMNRYAANAYIVCSVIYLVHWVIFLNPLRRSRSRSRLRLNSLFRTAAMRRRRRSVHRRAPLPARTGNGAGEPLLSSTGTERDPRAGSEDAEGLRGTDDTVDGVTRPDDADSDAPKAMAMVIFAVLFYVSVGVAFGIRYFNTYLDAVTQHNAIVRYAGYLSVTSLMDVADGIDGTSMGGPERCVQIFESTPSPALAALLTASCRRFWPAAVIGQERPAPTTGRNELDASVSFYDMLYFSFVSFTTTGYGDIRPHSDEVRRWVIIENIVEILFTAMFFVTAMEHAKS